LAITSRRRRRARLWREIVRVARADLDAVAEEIAALEAAVELDEGRARDAYYAAVGLHRDASGALQLAGTVDDLRAAARLSARARYEIAAARAVLTGAESPPMTPACFFDPGHGPSQRAVVFAPEGGQMRQLPACRACADEVDAGRAPALRRVIVNGHPAPYWRSPAHAGYYGSGSSSLDGLLALPVAGAVAGGVAESLLDAVIDMVNPI
jgi:hypothetical protein